MTFIEPYVLYIIVIIGNSSLIMNSQEYKTHNSCETARELVLRKFEPLSGRTPITFCVKK